MAEDDQSLNFLFDEAFFSAMPEAPAPEPAAEEEAEPELVIDGLEASVLNGIGTADTFTEMPDFRPDEMEKLHLINSYSYSHFMFSKACEFDEKALLYKARRVYEARLEQAIKKRKSMESEAKEDPKKRNPKLEEQLRRYIYSTYIQLGHTNLLAGDWTKSMFAYQRAFRLRPRHFRTDRPGLFGIGITYFHFRALNACIEAFTTLLYIERDIEVAVEIHVRLGIAFKCLGNIALARQHFHRALDDAQDSLLFSKAEIRFHIAHCTDAEGNHKAAIEEYKQLERDSAIQREPKILAHVYRSLGWVTYRTPTSNFPNRDAQLAEVKRYLLQAIDADKGNSRSYYYFGRYLSTTETKNDIPFAEYGKAIDNNDHDADTWCSIGVLYRRQGQDIDALQSFVCALLVNDKHSAAWASLGNLYENHLKFPEALYCYKKSINGNPSHPEPLKRRVQYLQKAIADNAHVLVRGKPEALAQHPQHPQPQKPTLELPNLERAWQDGIPNDQGHLFKQVLKAQRFLYRVTGSHHWKMSEMTATYAVRYPFEGLNDTQREIMHILRLNEELLQSNERELLHHLEEKSRRAEPRPAPQPRAPRPQETMLPTEGPEMKTFPFLAGDDFDAFLNDTEAPHTAAEDLPPPPKGAALPQTFSLLAPIHVPITVCASEIFEKCAVRLAEPEMYNPPIFDEHVPPPKPPIIPFKKRPKVEKLGLKTPLIKVEKIQDANSYELQTFCYKAPIALIRGLATTLRMDLSLFSTKTLIELQPDYPVEVRTQYRMPGDINVDQLGQPSWNCFSMRSSTNIRRYGIYQAESFRHSLKEETVRLRAAGTGSKYAIAAAEAAAAGTPLGTIATTAPAASLLSVTNPAIAAAMARKAVGADGPPAKRRRTGGQAAVNASAAKLAAAAELAGGPDDLPTGHMPMKVVKFGTNVDLSDETKFAAQLRELNKMPAFARNSASCNALTHLGHSVLGMNTVQLYMKVPGCRTPGHLENNCFASVNINIGPGECEWFGVDYEYWPVIDRMCKDRGIDLMKGSWWPNFEDLVRARVPVYRFTQKAGDIVWVGGGCVHWVQSVGWCNNVAWNVGPMTPEQLEMSLYAHEWNKLTEYRSLVPMQHLCWQLAANVRFSNQKMFNVVKGVLIRSLAFSRMVYDHVESRKPGSVKFQERIKGEIAHYCETCDVEVFNILFVKERHNKFNVYCVYCAKKANFEDYIALQQISFDELSETFDRFRLYPAKTPLLC
uniref:JmjC domain-containing protein n=1 Tax=Panagrellus redivivus TaxID=6233 RepID=A0A7E4UU74_PANRE